MTQPNNALQMLYDATGQLYQSQ